jgi:N6-adenosine-specific RNA methylase IME4
VSKLLNEASQVVDHGHDELGDRLSGEVCSSVIRAPRPGLHSAKPKIMYDIIERMYPGMRKIELFARGPARPGWTNWGLEAEGKKTKGLRKGG